MEVISTVLLNNQFTSSNSNAIYVLHCCSLSFDRRVWRLRTWLWDVSSGFSFHCRQKLSDRCFTSSMVRDATVGHWARQTMSAKETGGGDKGWTSCIRRSLSVDGNSDGDTHWEERTTNWCIYDEVKWGGFTRMTAYPWGTKCSHIWHHWSHGLAAILDLQYN